MIQNPFKKIFVDESGAYAGFRWWRRWMIAKWHLRCWLLYEGMPRYWTTTDEMLTWWNEMRRIQREMEEKRERISKL